MQASAISGKQMWIRYRAEIIELDGGKCVRCGRGCSDNAVLQVHHKHYLPGKLPWEHPPAVCETLCKGCHAAEHGIVPPKEGWQLVGSEDYGDLLGECELCSTPIRHVYLVFHQHWEPLLVGTHCCDRLTGVDTATRITEGILRYERRRARFIASPRWKRKLGSEVISQSGLEIEIRREGFDYFVILNGVHGRVAQKSVENAKALAYQVIENGAAQRYLQRRWA